MELNNENYDSVDKWMSKLNSNKKSAVKIVLHSGSTTKILQTIYLITAWKF